MPLDMQEDVCMYQICFIAVCLRICEICELHFFASFRGGGLGRGLSVSRDVEKIISPCYQGPGGGGGGAWNKIHQALVLFLSREIPDYDLLLFITLPNSRLVLA